MTTLVEAPDTDVARRARELLIDCCTPAVVGHSERSFQFAALLARAESADVDLEVLYVGTVLHDVGLSPRFDGTARFEMRGANAVRAMLLDGGMERRRAESVWDVIALHASSAIAAHKSPETRLANAGISIDIRGAGAESLAPDDVRSVLDQWPRHEFPAAFSETLIGEVRAHAGSVRSSWMECIALAHVPGFEAADFLATLQGSSRFV
ncbi:MAG TPA: HD domain-containing protein [Ilumatobacteraceae bacterium]|nr:HD domain-containing protein [Ilumatobacteraceae bacterium]